MIRRAEATVHGAISIVNAIPTGIGVTAGTQLCATATVTAEPGEGISISTKNISAKLAAATIRHAVPKRSMSNTHIHLEMKSDIPTGYGLKSSSAVSTAVSMACAKLFVSGSSDKKILLAGVRASIETNISITGAYDDACACYFGGFNITDNAKKRIIRQEKAPENMSVTIFIPNRRKRGNPKKLRGLKGVFRRAASTAREGNYWDAMTINGLAASEILGTQHGMISDLLDAGALAASVSGNGPAVAAVSKNAKPTRDIFSRYDGRVIETRFNNVKAEARLI